MRATVLAALSAAFVAAGAAGCAGRPSVDDVPGRTPPPRTLRAFASRAEMEAWVGAAAEEYRKRQVVMQDAVTTDAAPTAAAAPEPETGVAGDVAAKAEESVTNVQHAGVDEGGIVKLRGDHLVMLRRGRLFTVDIAGGSLRPVSAVDAFGPGVDPGGAWYDELLVSGDVVVVIGYSYQRGGTEVGLFHLAADGTLTHRSTWHMRSGDYYSSRNYASRLIGEKLVFYTPLPLPMHGGDLSDALPGIRRWHDGAQDSLFRSFVPPSRVYRPERAPTSGWGLAMHTVTTCDLGGAEMTCDGTAVVGPMGRVFYVSPTSVYIWTADEGAYWDGDDKRRRDPSMVYRMPLDGSAPTALTVSGAPVDQFSFLESEDGHLNVLVRSEAVGDGMWGPEVAQGDVALLRVPLDSFGDGTVPAPATRYRALPRPAGYTFQNRFVGAHLLYGTGSGWGAPEGGHGALFAVPWAGGEVASLDLPHGVDRIEVMGSGAMVVGTDGRDLHFSGVRLDGAPRLADRYTQRGASQGELRSHGFFYRGEGRDTGILGLPVRGPGRPGYEHLFHESASILFLRNDSFRLTPLGELESRPEGSADDGCRASCVDWYGNARPLFVRGRVFALLGYEIVEGAVSDGRIRETRRISYAPRPAMAARE